MLELNAFGFVKNRIKPLIVRIEFDDGISKPTFDRLFQEVQTRFNNVDLPDNVLDTDVSDFSAADFRPVIEVILSENVDYPTLNKQAKLLYERLQDVNEVSSVDLLGDSDRQVLISVNRNKLEALDICIDQIVQAIRGRNVTIPGGNLKTATRDYLIRTEGKIENFFDFSSIIVRKNDPTQRGVVHLGDLATINEIYEDNDIIARFNKQRSIALKIAKITGGSSTGLVKDVKKVVSEFERQLPRSVKISVFGDSTIQINKSLEVLTSNAVYGLFLLVVILLIFIGLRNALIVALGIPITFAMTFLLLGSFEETLNTNTLFALVLGLIVDHAIVIIENCYRLQQEGLSKIDAAISGDGPGAIPERGERSARGAAGFFSNVRE